jgi:hypothetical protein|tara:strand:+ start:26 stop:373 length:348 start_codon:yes stop_codon:yes gene_type:complete
MKKNKLQPHIKLAEEISFRLLATRNHPEYDWLVNILNKDSSKDKSSIKSFLENKYVKLCFSFAILGSAIPSIYQDFTYGHQGTWTHYGMGLVGILYFIESLLWTLDLWKSNSEQN